MLAICLIVVIGLTLSGLVLAYVAYPHRGQEMPKARWLGQALSMAVDQLPTLDNTAERARAELDPVPQ